MTPEERALALVTVTRRPGGMNTVDVGGAGGVCVTGDSHVTDAEADAVASELRALIAGAIREDREDRAVPGSPVDDRSLKDALDVVRWAREWQNTFLTFDQSRKVQAMKAASDLLPGKGLEVAETLVKEIDFLKAVLRDASGQGDLSAWHAGRNAGLEEAAVVAWEWGSDPDEDTGISAQAFQARYGTNSLADALRARKEKP